jgi:DNA-3-methyladenine glycosylase I
MSGEGQDAALDSVADVIVGADGTPRCRWTGTDEEYRRYHDEEWGRPLHGDLALFEKLSLEAFQAGLSWITILRRRPAFREAFDGFDPRRVSAYGPDDIERLMGDERIIRNRAKVLATIANARLTFELLMLAPGALDELMWSFAPPKRPSRFRSMTEVPALTPESTAMSNELRRLGFRFVGPTTMYALMQSTCMVDDHVAECWRAH